MTRGDVASKVDGSKSFRVPRDRAPARVAEIRASRITRLERRIGLLDQEKMAARREHPANFGEHRFRVCVRHVLQHRERQHELRARVVGGQLLERRDVLEAKLRQQTARGVDERGFALEAGDVVCALGQHRRQPSKTASDIEGAANHRPGWPPAEGIHARRVARGNCATTPTDR